MATKLKHQAQQQSSNPGAAAVPLSKCCAEGCGKKTDILTFCNEHYDWFKFGLITKAGKRPSDFDKKWTAYQSHGKKRVA